MTCLQAPPRRLFSLPSQLNAKSPFRTSSGTAGRFRSVAFEIEWKDICGFNYFNPLCNDGRVVIEAAKLTKRQFMTVSGIPVSRLTPVSCLMHSIPQQVGLPKPWHSNSSLSCSCKRHAAFTSKRLSPHKLVRHASISVLAF